MRYTHATKSDFARNKGSEVKDFHKRQMDFIMSSFKVCNVPTCRIMVRHEADLLCTEHLTAFVDDMATRNSCRYE